MRRRNPCNYVVRNWAIGGPKAKQPLACGVRHLPNLAYAIFNFYRVRLSRP